MKKRWLYRGLFALVVLLAAAWEYYQFNDQATNKQATTPTVFVHGWRGSAHSTNDLIRSIQERRLGQKVLTITVAANGKLSYSGFWRHGVKNPLIQIVYTNNRAGEVQYERWLVKIMHQLHRRYHVQTVNLVGHSMGAYAVTYYTLKHGQQTNLPRVAKLVALAGPFDGIMGKKRAFHPKDGTTWTDRPHANHLKANGKPVKVHPEYRRLLQLRQQFPKQTKVLNVYGDLKDGSHSDGVVSVTSATALGYLVKQRAASYRVAKVTGPNAQHSRLHQNNHRVNRLLREFLFQTKR